MGRLDWRAFLFALHLAADILVSAMDGNGTMEGCPKFILGMVLADSDICSRNHIVLWFGASFIQIAFVFSTCLTILLEQLALRPFYYRVRLHQFRKNHR
jgi:hypothetical protein